MNKIVGGLLLVAALGGGYFAGKASSGDSEYALGRKDGKPFIEVVETGKSYDLHVVAGDLYLNNSEYMGRMERVSLTSEVTDKIVKEYLGKPAAPSIDSKFAPSTK
jgi:hypothetical protein